MTSFYDGLDAASPLLGVHRPTEPSLGQERYLDNEIHTVSTNAIVKLRKELELTANAHYIHDFQTSEGGSVTTYYLPDAVPLVIEEQTFADRRRSSTLRRIIPMPSRGSTAAASAPVIRPLPPTSWGGGISRSMRRSTRRRSVWSRRSQP